MARIALVTAVESRSHDADLPLLQPACAAAGLDAHVVGWDDPSVSWRRFDAAVLRSPWNYMERLPAFLDWCARVDRRTRLLNPLSVVRWNTDKHYLADLAARGVPVVPTRFVEPGADPAQALEDFLAAHRCEEFVVKPAVSAGSRDTRRHARAGAAEAIAHLARLVDAGRSAMLQPYQHAVDTRGETALLYFRGRIQPRRPQGGAAGAQRHRPLAHWYAGGDPAERARRRRARARRPHSRHRCRTPGARRAARVRARGSRAR